MLLTGDWIKLRREPTPMWDCIDPIARGAYMLVLLRADIEHGSMRFPVGDPAKMLAKSLGLPEDAVAELVAVGALVIDGGSVKVPDWDEQQGADSNADKQRRRRARNAANKPVPPATPSDTPVTPDRTPGDTAPYPVEESRGEQSKEEQRVKERATPRYPEPGTRPKPPHASSGHLAELKLIVGKVECETGVRLPRWSMNKGGELEGLGELIQTRTWDVVCEVVVWGAREACKSIQSSSAEAEEKTRALWSCLWRGAAFDAVLGRWEAEKRKASPGHTGATETYEEHEARMAPEREADPRPLSWESRAE